MSTPPQKSVPAATQPSTRAEARALARAEETARERIELTSALARARKRLSQRILAVNRDLDRIEEAQAWASRAPWLVAAAARAPRGAKSLDVSDWSSGEERVFSFPLDPARSPREQVEAAFQRARRLRRGKPQAEERIAEAKKAIVAVDGLLEVLKERQELRELDASSGDDENAELQRLRDQAFAALPHDVRGILSPTPDLPRKGIVLAEGKKPPFRSFTARSGLRILVGRRADLNDTLTFQVSRPHHLWLHAKDQPGAHVIAWNEKGKALTQDELVDAASLAAHFSDARGESIVDVTYTARKYVRKPRRAPPGMVIADRTKVIAVRIDAAQLKALLGTEVEG